MESRGVEQMMEHARLHPLAHAAEDTDGRADDEGDHHHPAGALPKGEGGRPRRGREDVAAQIVGAEVVDVARAGPGGRAAGGCCADRRCRRGSPGGPDEGDQQQQAKAPEPPMASGLRR